MSRGLIIAATDTDAGKTYVTAALWRFLQAKGVNVVPVKPIQTGYPMDNDLTYCGGKPLLHFVPACSPHLAAEQAGVRIDMDELVLQIQTIQTQADIVLLETAGGVQTPIVRPDVTMLDLMARVGWPVLFVVPNRLGCVNHALLSLEAIRQRGLECFGFVMNKIVEGDALIQGDNAQTIADFSKAPCLGEFACGQSELPPELAKQLRAFARLTA